MATPYYSWPIPAQGIDPWYDPIDRLFSSIDVTVHSIESVTRDLHKTTVVFSFFPSGTALIAASTSTVSPDDSIVVSCAPYGRLVGGFIVPFSGAQARFSMHPPQFGEARSWNAPMAVAGLCRLVDGTQPSTLNLIGNSEWSTEFRYSRAVITPRYTAVASLGIGRYTAELQMRAIAVFMTTSNYVCLNSIAGPCWLQVTVEPRTS